MDTVTQKPYGRSLKDFLPLLPAEKKLKLAARRGEVAVIDEALPKESMPNNQIRGEFLRFLALGGDERTPLHERGVELIGAWITGNFDVEACDIKSSFFAHNSHFETSPVFRDTHIRGLLGLSGSQIPGLQGDRLIADGGVFLCDGLSATEEVRLIGAQIKGNLACIGSSFTSTSGNALLADSAIIAGGVFLSGGFKAQGEVRLIGAQIATNLECNGGAFSNKDGDALSADGANIQGDVVLSHGFRATGTVRLPGVHIGGDLVCGSGSFTNEHGVALLADSAKIGGQVSLIENFQAKGSVSLRRAHIGGIFDCTGCSISVKKDNALSADGIFVTGSFFFRETKPPLKGVSLSSGQVGALIDDESSWEEGLTLDGFVYNSLAGAAPCDAETRLNWLAKQSEKHYKNPSDFRPQPWKQLIRTLRKMGHDEEARQVTIAFETHRRRCKVIKSRTRRAFHWMFGLLIGYGYRPLRLLYIMLGTWLLCAAMYWTAASHDVFAPSNPLVFHHPDYFTCRPGYLPGPMQPGVPHTYGNWYLCPHLAGEYTGFSPLAYSLDLILPLVDLQQEHDWAPYIPTPKAVWYEELGQFFAPEMWKYHWTRLLVWFEILFGWVASLLLVAIVSGLTNRDKDE